MLKIKEIIRLLNAIKLYEKNGKSARAFVCTTFNQEPVKEADLPNYSEIEKISHELNLIKINSQFLELQENGIKIINSIFDRRVFNI